MSSQQTVIGVYADPSQAQKAVAALKQAGYSDAHIDVMGQNNYTDTSSREKRDEGIGGFFRSLFSDDKEDNYRDLHDTARRGTVVTVHTQDMTTAERAADMLDSYGAINSDDASQRLRSKGVAYEDRETTLDSIKEFFTGDDDSNDRDRDRQHMPMTPGAQRMKSRVVNRPVDQAYRLRDDNTFSADRNSMSSGMKENDRGLSGLGAQAQPASTTSGMSGSGMSGSSLSGSGMSGSGMSGSGMSGSGISGSAMSGSNKDKNERNMSGSAMNGSNKAQNEHNMSGSAMSGSNANQNDQSQQSSSMSSSTSGQRNLSMSGNDIAGKQSGNMSGQKDSGMSKSYDSNMGANSAQQGMKTDMDFDPAHRNAQNVGANMRDGAMTTNRDSDASTDMNFDLAQNKDQSDMRDNTTRNRMNDQLSDGDRMVSRNENEELRKSGNMAKDLSQDVRKTGKDVKNKLDRDEAGELVNIDDLDGRIG